MALSYRSPKEMNKVGKGLDGACTLSVRGPAPFSALSQQVRAFSVSSKGFPPCWFVAEDYLSTMAISGNNVTEGTFLSVRREPESSVFKCLIHHVLFCLKDVKNTKGVKAQMPLRTYFFMRNSAIKLAGVMRRTLQNIWPLLSALPVTRATTLIWFWLILLSAKWNLLFVLQQLTDAL